MTERQAMRDGLQFTGHYSSYDLTIKKVAADLRKRGYKAIMVDSKSGCGRSVYAEKRYFADQVIHQNTPTIESLPLEEAHALAKYEAALKEIRDNAARAKETNDKLIKEYYTDLGNEYKGA